MAAGAFERLVPPWETVTVDDHGPLRDGVVRRLRVGPLRMPWEALHDRFVEGRQFRDVQRRGPFRRWEHTHRFLPLEQGRSYLEDDITWESPLRWLLEPLFDRTFAWRHRTTRLDLQRHRRVSQRWRIGVSGSSGLIGSQLCAFLSTGGHEVVRLGRQPAPEEGLDAVVHLAGRSIAEGRWTASVKRAILESRSLNTEALCRHLAGMRRPPRVLVCASAAGYYGDGSQPCEEGAAAGQTFLARVCQAWEAATEPARGAGIRVVNLRIGVVLSARGGALGEMLLPFRWGLGAVPGRGAQWLSWISHQDMLGAIYHCLFQEGLSGPVNAGSPQPVTMGEFCLTLARVLDRPLWGSVPSWALRLGLGEKADIVLQGQRMVPRRLLESGFEFFDPELELALRHELGR